VIEYSWINKVLNAGWQVSKDGLDREFLFSKLKLRNVPRNLRKGRPAEVKDGFAKLFSDEQFTQWWDQTCAGKEDKFVRLRFPRQTFPELFFTSPWDVPWELLVERLAQTQVQSSISIVRTLPVDPPVAPAAFDTPMRILIIQGDDGKRVRAPLNLAREAELIQQAWESLDHEAKQCVDKPLVVKGREDSLVEELNRYNPNVLWFSGHGRATPDSSFLFEDGKWITARRLAELITKASETPLYAVFWACETGRAEEGTTTSSPSAPPFFEELSRAGVISILAMQSPIRDVSALSMAESLLGFLAVGFPLERAVARARGRLIEDLPEGAHRLDWATPVVWSATAPVERLTWNSPVKSFPQLQLLGRLALRSRRKRPSELDGPPSQDELARARIWVSYPRMWIQAQPGDAEIQNRWTRALQAIQVETDRLVIAVDLRGDEIEVALREWADYILSRILPGDIPNDFAFVLEHLQRAQISGWKRLCELDKVIVAVAQPPPYESRDSWFWEPLRVRNKDLVAILSDQEITEEIKSEWTIEGIRREMDADSIQAAVSEAPRLATALAVLNMPLRSYLISVPAKESEGARTLNEWQAGNNVLIKTNAGPVMAATARHHILHTTEAALLKRAHSDCVRMLDQPHVRPTTEIREEILQHLLGVGSLDQPVLKIATDLCFEYREQDRPAAVLQLIQRIDHLWDSLPRSARLIPAWAYLQLGKLDEAELFLRASAPVEPLDVAWRHGLLAELYKSLGRLFSKEDALREIEEAIEVCRTATPDAANPEELLERQLRAYRQDRARILQFLFYEKEKAAAEYQQLLNEWDDQPEALIDLAVVKRNYSECLRSLASGPEDPKRQYARDLLQEAEQLVRDKPHLPVLSEILYEKAKAAEEAGNLSEVHKLLLEVQQAALQSRHRMVWAIAENWLFWTFKSFSIAEWEKVRSDLEGFPHGWAVRTLVDGRLRASRKLEELKDFAGAFAQVEAARVILNANPSFNMGGDKLRIVRTMAGLQILGQQTGRDGFWDLLISNYEWATGWLQERGISTPEAVWSEVN